MGGRKGKKKAQKKAQKMDKQSKEHPADLPVDLPQMPKRARQATLPLADPATPILAVMSQKVLTPELQRSMAAIDAADVVAAAGMVSPTVQAKEAAAIIDRQTALLVTTFRRVKAEEQTLERRLEEVIEQIAMLKQKWDEGKISMTRQRYMVQIEKTLQLQQEIMRRLSLLRTKGAALAGSWASDMITTRIKRDVAEDWVLIDAVLRCYPELEEARRTIKSHRTDQQQLFRKKLIEKYGGGPTDADGRIYCPISHERITSKLLRAAHIVNVNVGAKTTASLFGEGVDHLWNPKNGLLIHEEFKKLIDEAKAVILPASNDPEETELMLVLLTRDIGQQQNNVWGYEVLHGRRLKFLNNYRPSRCYLYFKAVMSLLRRRRAEVDGHWKDLDQLPTVAKTMWATPGPYLKNSILYRFSRELGCLTKEDANRFWDVDTEAAFAGLEIEDKNTAAELALQASNAALERVEEEEDAEKDDDDPFV